MVICDRRRVKRNGKSTTFFENSLTIQTNLNKGYSSTVEGSLRRALGISLGTGNVG